jgi:hypothetical protein
MFYLVPRCKFKLWLAHTGNKMEEFSDCDIEYKDWEHELPVLVIEGTGLLRVIPLPLEYYTRKWHSYSKLKDRLIEEEKQIRKVFLSIHLPKEHSTVKDILADSSNPIFTSYAVPEMSEWDEETRLSFFYRYITMIFPINPSKGKTGLKISKKLVPHAELSELSAYTVEELRPVTILSSSASTTEWKWGVAYEHYVAGNENIGLLKMPEMTTAQRTMTLKILKHIVHWGEILLPTEEYTIGKQGKRKTFESWDKLFSDIWLDHRKSKTGHILTDYIAPLPIDSVSQVTGESVAKEPVKELFLHNLYAKFGRVTEENIKKVAESIVAKPHVVDAVLTLEHYTNHCALVRLQLLIQFT